MQPTGIHGASPTININTNLNKPSDDKGAVKESSNLPKIELKPFTAAQATNTLDKNTALDLRKDY